MLHKFDQATDSPIRYDQDNICYLENRYQDRMHTIKKKISSQKWFYHKSLQSKAMEPIKREAFARHMFLAFSVSDAFAVDTILADEIIAHYSMLRILPILSYNEIFDFKNVHPTDCLKTGLLNIVAILKGNIHVSKLPNGDKLWNVFTDIHSRIIEIVYNELVCRFDRDMIDHPDNGLAKYSTEYCPLLRSSMMEILVKFFSIASNKRVKSNAWLTAYEKARQLLDDIADIEADLLMGRMTYPVLYALHHEEQEGLLHKRVKKIWMSAESGEYVLSIDESAELRKLLYRLTANHLKSLIEAWLLKVDEQIDLEDFPGDCEPIKLHVELKRAFLYRLLDDNFKM